MKAEAPEGHITDYERAVCYYTLPKVTSPLTYGLLIAYAICVLEAIAALVYGLVTNNETWTIAGAAALGGIVVFGMIAFTVRALLNDLHRRAALAAAKSVPDSTETDDIPDPFAGHVLLQRPINIGADVFACVTKTDTIAYYVEVKRYNKHWRVSSAQDEFLFEVVVEQDLLRPRVFGGPPMRLGVFADNKKIAAIVRYNTLRAAVVDVFTVVPSPEQYVIKNDCIYFADRLIGRIYVLRNKLYLDVESEHAVPGILGHFMTMR